MRPGCAACWRPARRRGRRSSASSAASRPATRRAPARRSSACTTARLATSWRIEGDLQHRPAVASRPPAGMDRNGIPDAQLVLLHLALGRSPGRAARALPAISSAGSCAKNRRCTAWGYGGRSQSGRGQVRRCFSAVRCTRNVTIHRASRWHSSRPHISTVNKRSTPTIQLSTTAPTESSLVSCFSQPCPAKWLYRRVSPDEKVP